MSLFSSILELLY